MTTEVGSMLKILMCSPVPCRLSTGLSDEKVEGGGGWRVILALQAFSGIHVGVYNLNVLRGVAKLVDIATIHSMLGFTGA